MKVFRSANLQRPSRTVKPAKAQYREWPDPELIKEVKESFPEKAIANVEEARCLVSSLGYTYVDVRPALECQEVGKCPLAVNIPLMNSQWKWNSESRKKELVKEDNEKFIEMFMKRFPKKDTKLLIGCSDGTSYCLDALDELDAEGYENLVGLKGGYYAWFRKFDNKLKRRRHDGYTENFTHDGDGCGIHGTGAGFERMDKIESWVPPAY